MTYVNTYMYDVALPIAVFCVFLEKTSEPFYVLNGVVNGLFHGCHHSFGAIFHITFFKKSSVCFYLRST